MDREKQLEKDLVLMYWRIGSLVGSPATEQLWQSIKSIIKDRGIDINQEFELDGLAAEIKAKLDERQSNNLGEKDA